MRQSYLEAQGASADIFVILKGGAAFGLIVTSTVKGLCQTRYEVDEGVGSRVQGGKRLRTVWA